MHITTETVRKECLKMSSICLAVLPTGEEKTR
jgi:hypothetical protein